MATVGQLCDQHKTQVRRDTSLSFLKTVIEPLLKHVEQVTGFKASYEVPHRLDPQAKTVFVNEDKTSKPLTIDYVTEDPEQGACTLMIWVDQENIPPIMDGRMISHTSGLVFMVPREWGEQEFAQLIQF